MPEGGKNLKEDEEKAWNSVVGHNTDRKKGIHHADDFKRFPHLFKRMVYLCEENFMFSTHEWSHKSDAPIPEFLNVRGVSESTWLFFLQAIHSIHVSHPIGFLKMFQIPLLVFAFLATPLFGYFLYEVCDVAQQESVCDFLYAGTSLGVVAGIIALLVLGPVIACLRNRFLVVLQEKCLKLQEHFTFEDKTCSDGVVRSLSIGAYIYEIESDLNGAIFCFVFDDPNDPLETIHSEHSKIARENQLKLDQLKEENESENSSTDQLKEENESENSSTELDAPSIGLALV